MGQSRPETELRGVDVAGPPDGQPIVFVHGAMFTRSMWAPQREALADEYRVVAPDLPGHGDRREESFDLEPAMDVLEGVVDSAAGGHAVLVGLSLGGYLVAEYASRHPDQVDGLVVVGASANPVRTMNLVTRAVGGIARVATQSDVLEGVVRRLGERWVRNRDLPPAMEAEIIDAGIYPAEFGTPGPDLAGTNFRRKLTDYPGPTLIVNGERDKIMRLGETEHAMAAGGDADVVVLKDVGHVCNLHRPDDFTMLLRRFLGRRVAPT